MFRLPLNMSCQLLSGGFAVACRFGLRLRHADDVTKFASGFLQLQHRNYNRSWHPQRPAIQVTNFLHLNNFSSKAALRNVHPFHQAACYGQFLQTRDYSTNPDSKDSSKLGEASVGSQSTAPPAAEAGEKKLSIFQRFKQAYKEHGKILVAVHVATSTVWYGSFYIAARCGVDLVPYMEQWGFSETVIKPFRAGGLGDFAVAYLMYKLATPARYTVTLGGTNLVIRYLRSKGKMAPKSEQDSLRVLYKEGREKLKNSKLRKDRLKRLKLAREKKKEAKWRKGKHF